MYDPELYRAKAEIERWKQRDPIARFARPAARRGPARTTTTSSAIEAEVAAEIDDAVAFAEAGTLEPVEDLTRFVYAEDEVGMTEPAPVDA